MASTRLNLKQPYLFTPEAAIRICTLLTQSVGPVSITAWCADGLSRDYGSAEQLISYDNLKSRQIDWLMISSRSTQPWADAQLIFKQGPLTASGTVEFQMTAPVEKNVVDVKNEIAVLIKEMRPWYSRFATFSFASVIVVAVAIVWAIAIFGVGFGLVTLTPSTDSNGEARANAQMWVIIFAIAFVIWILTKLRDRVFPISVFALGQGAYRHATLENVRWVVVIGLFVSIAGSIIVALLWQAATGQPAAT